MTKYVSWLRCRIGDFDRFVCVPFPAEHDLYLVIEEICMFLLHGSGLFCRRLWNQIQRIHTEVYHPVNQDSWLYILLELELHYTLLYSIIHGIQPHFHLEFASDCYVGMFFSRHFQGQRFNKYCAPSHNHNSPILYPNCSHITSFQKDRGIIQRLSLFFIKVGDML